MGAVALRSLDDLAAILQRPEPRPAPEQLTML